MTASVFLPRYRIRLEISSSSFPRYDRDTNTGGTIAEESLDEAVVATNLVLHGVEHLSRLVLPIIGRRPGSMSVIRAGGRSSSWPSATAWPPGRLRRRSSTRSPGGRLDACYGEGRRMLLVSSLL